MRRTVDAVLRKELRLELRAPQAVPAMALFSVTTLVVFHFALQRGQVDGDLAAGVLWVTLLFAAMLGTSRLFVADHEEGGLDGFLLAPTDRTALLALADAGIALVGTMVGAMAVQTRTRDLIVPLMALPLLIPVVIGAAKGTSPLLTLTGPHSVEVRWLLVLGLYDLVFGLLAYALFDYLIED